MSFFLKVCKHRHSISFCQWHLLFSHWKIVTVSFSCQWKIVIDLSAFTKCECVLMLVSVFKRCNFCFGLRNIECSWHFTFVEYIDIINGCNRSFSNFVCKLKGFTTLNNREASLEYGRSYNC